MAFVTKLQDLVTAINDLNTAVGLFPAIETALTGFNTFLNSL